MYLYQIVEGKISENFFEDEGEFLKNFFEDEGENPTTTFIIVIKK